MTHNSHLVPLVPPSLSPAPSSNDTFWYIILGIIVSIAVLFAVAMLVRQVLASRGNVGK